MFSNRGHDGTIQGFPSVWMVQHFVWPVGLLNAK
jgi:hypothetical protein